VATTTDRVEVVPAGEAARLAALRRYDILDTPPDGAFDRITALAARLFDVPIALVSVVDADRIWFKSRHGLPDTQQIGREPGLCASAICHHTPWVVTDAGQDPRTLANPLVAGSFGLRFYAGIPLTTSDGHNLGTLCVIDREPREVTEEELATLQDLAGVVMDELELRLTARRTLARETAMRRQAQGLADALQASLLPPVPPELPGMELATRYEPGETGLSVGGDFYDVFRLGPNDWGFVVGDVCGKGARAASLTALARWSVRAAAVHSFMPSAVLRDLNTVLLHDADTSSDDHFCTAVFGRVQLDTCGAWVTLASGGHPRPVVVRRAGWIDLRGHVSPPLGMFPDASPADDRIGLGPGDAIVVCTDGITEAHQGTGELFGDEAMPELLLESAGSPAETVARDLVGAARRFAGGRFPDDVAILVLRVPEDATDDPLARVSQATGLPPSALRLPGHPLGDRQPDLWRRRPEPPREAWIRLAPQVENLARLRQHLRRLLQSWRMEELLGGDLELLATEVATNAILHAESTMTVIVRYLGPVVRVEVGDGSRELPVPAMPGPRDLSGRGLQLVRSLASDWGVKLTRTGKRVWFEVSADGVPAEGHSAIS
jgi:sigma-B regulation protein RsbU (phosphoserine phosphatase)